LVSGQAKADASSGFDQYRHAYAYTADAFEVARNEKARVMKAER